MDFIYLFFTIISVILNHFLFHSSLAWMGFICGFCIRTVISGFGTIFLLSLVENILMLYLYEIH